MVKYEYLNDIRIISSNSDNADIRNTLVHSLEYRLDDRFEIFLVNGEDEVEVLKTSNRNSDYILYWLRETLRKLENGLIKVIGPSSRERKWEIEEQIRNHLWENIKITEKLLTELNNLPELSKEDKEKGLATLTHLDCPISYKSRLGVTICTQQEI